MKIKPLDCIFFKGTDVVSQTISSVEKIFLGSGDWTHIGLVVSKSLIPSLNVKDNEMYIWESTMSTNNKLILENNTLDAESNSGVFGVQVRKLKDVVSKDMKNGVTVGWGKLINNPIDKKENEKNDEYLERISSLRKSLNILHSKYYHKSYAKNIFRLAGALSKCLYPCRSKCCIGNDWVFCSQFVSIVYKEIGVLGLDIDTETVLPQDIATPELSEEKFNPIIEKVKILNPTLLQQIL